MERAQTLYRQRLNAGYRDTDPLFAVLLLLEWLLGIVFATLISPYAWAGETVSLHIMVWAAVILGGAIVSLPVGLVLLRPGAGNHAPCRGDRADAHVRPVDPPVRR